MRWVATGAAAAAVTAGGVAVGRALAGHGRGNWPVVHSADERHAHWQVVTVNRSCEELMPDGRLPEPLAELGDRVEVRTCPAPGDRGTELAVRLRVGEPSGLTGMAAHLTGDDPRLALRAALRRAKQVAETGEVLSPDRPPTTRTLLNRPLDIATGRAREEGLP
jgi:hypothetical protein